MAENRFKAMGQNMYSPRKTPSKEKTTEVPVDDNSEKKKNSTKNTKSTETSSKSTKLTTKPVNKNASTKQASASDKDIAKATSPSKPAKDATKGKKRGRKEGTVLVAPSDRRKTMSISVDPKDEALYKEVLQKYPKRFKGLSQLVEQALDYFITENKLI